MSAEYDTEPDPSDETAPETAPQTGTAHATRTEPEAKPSRWAKLTDNLLLPVFSGAAVLMLGFILTTTNARISDTNNKIDQAETRINDRIDKLETRINDRIDKLETRINDRIDKLETRIDTLETKINEINLKLTALIAALNKSNEVDDALSGIVAPAEP